MKRFDIARFNKVVAHVKSCHFITDEEAKKAAIYTMNEPGNEDDDEMTFYSHGVIGMFTWGETKEGCDFWHGVTQRKHTPYNKYSGWIFDYLENHVNLGRMCCDFSREFFGRSNAFTSEQKLTFLSDEDKLTSFWLLAHVDQETADSMLSNFK